jgi:hypothetical protein
MKKRLRWVKTPIKEDPKFFVILRDDLIIISVYRTERRLDPPIGGNSFGALPSPDSPPRPSR